MFSNCTSFPTITHWDVSNVTNMRSMFTRCIDGSANQPIGDWDVSSVTDMSYMFNGANFNQIIGNWDVSNVTDMEGMFYENSVFNQDIGNWNVSNVSECNNFSTNPQWSLPQPNFTNCNPD